MKPLIQVEEGMVKITGTVILGLVLAIALLLFGLFFPALRQRWRLHAHRSKLPSGPKINQIGIRKPWLSFQELSNEDGDVVYLQLLSRGTRGLVALYSSFWRHRRKALHYGFMQRQSESFRPIQNLESKDDRTHLEHYATSMIVTATYGRSILGKFAVEQYSALEYVPSILALWKAEVLTQQQKDADIYLKLLSEIKDKIKRGVAADCSTTYLINEQKNLDMNDLGLAYAAGPPFGAGVERLHSQPQAELDKVNGSDRLPTFEDMASFPYVAAIIPERLRWRPIAVSGGTPHASIADDTYREIFIPKGSTNDFHDPHGLSPERSLEHRKYPGLTGHSAFGWGRPRSPKHQNLTEWEFEDSLQHLKIYAAEHNE
ncbi:cytochrome P450 [Neurospora hispaniola]|uniref:Cytochrome P450 n=1 Tax=Neurospora hispaniola TaxID=588809 RepID=A0AAJ0MQ32_9PEZI|nr:cytochrome P450 [Neurospora hispaniola]